MNDDVFKINKPRDGTEKLFYEKISGYYWWAKPETIIYAEYELNRNYTLRGRATLEELYSLYGIPVTEYSKTVGWSTSIGYDYGYEWIDFVHKKIKSKDPNIPNYYEIRLIFPPTKDYLDEQ